MKVHYDRAQCVDAFSTKENVTSTHFNGKRVGFGVIIPHLKLNIFTVAFHGPPINFNDSEIRYHPNKTMKFFLYSLMNKVMCASTIN